jgi:hypothetical protein
MTLTCALIADRGIILAADSQVTVTHEVFDNGHPRSIATYAGQRSKIRSLRNGSAFSIAGNSGLVDALLAKAELEGIDGTKPFEVTGLQYSRLFRAEYLKAYSESDSRPHCAFLFCGYLGENGRRVPQIVKLSSENVFTWNPVATSKGYGFTGREEHGAVLYLLHRLYSPGMPMDEAKCLAYCILAEVADLDNIVDRPIEMAVLMESGLEPFPESDFDRYDKKRQQIIQAVRTLILSA